MVALSDRYRVCRGLMPLQAEADDATQERKRIRENPGVWRSLTQVSLVNLQVAHPYELLKTTVFSGDG